jgi:hypothetical protein
VLAQRAKIEDLDTVTTQPTNTLGGPPQEPAAPRPPAPPEGSPEWYSLPFETRESIKARERVARASRRADRAARRLREAQERASGQRTGKRQFLDVAGDAATAALTVVSAAADEAQARLAAKARMRELEQSVVTARAGGRVEVSPPTRTEALMLADRVDPGSSGASVARGVGLILAGIVALVMAVIGGFAVLGVGVPGAILIGGVWVGNRIQIEDRSRKAAVIQLELARASLPAGELKAGAVAGQLREGVRPASSLPEPAPTGAGLAGEQLRLSRGGDPRTRSEVLAGLDHVIANVEGLLEEGDVATLQRIREDAALALPATDAALDLSDHETWLLRQICIDYLPGALEHYIALPADLASEPVLDGRSAREVLDEQLALIERRLDQMATRTYRREAGDLLTHARFLADVLRPDPFRARLAELAAEGSASAPVAALEPGDAAEASATMDGAAGQRRERA